MREESRMLLLELPSSLLSHQSRVYSASTFAGSNSLHGGDIPRSPAVHDADKRVAQIVEESFL